MLNKISLIIKNKINRHQQKQEKENKRKYYEIRGAVIKFYEDKQKTGGKAELPAFIQADNILKEVIKTPADINFYYNKLLKYKAVA